MDSPFFRNRRWYQKPDPVRRPFSHSPSFHEVPVYHVDPTREAHRPVHSIHRSPERYTGPKVVQIPVHFVGTEQVGRSGSAVKIQKVFRGFLVRKCLKKIKDIKVQVDEIEERLLRSEVVDMVRRDERERLRMNESLMSLLFKLDSISGLDFGVRVCRKAVIRKAIALQERIDAIVAVDSEGNGETVDQETEIKASDSSNQSRNGETVDQETEIKASDSLNQPDDPVKPKDSSENVEKLGGSLENQETLEDGNCVGGEDHTMKVEGNDGEDDVIDVGVDREVKVIEANCVGKGVVDNLDLIEESLTEGDEKEDGKPTEGNGADDNKRDRELLDRMMEDNEKMMRLMTQLFERNEAQMRMLNALTNRVELLEKAVVCDRQRKKKKKKHNPCRDD